ncbi:MAG: AtpZ/AtpI family protein [Oscillospiraceae bacterium]|nr:AtpZ/AtpI family protein [Oscillospiraceae bacterium]MCD8254578.1 AtpZ/AtpI family protein [Oscillospiraceae bacterium]MCD8343976.1 AtpZ/AtpI family protein [Oscillospiraceae bacterium]MCD8374339.1 AtpZ/AtpI family protein [Oscillospiraceae bacterium]
MDDENARSETGEQEENDKKKRLAALGGKRMTIGMLLGLLIGAVVGQHYGSADTGMVLGMLLGVAAGCAWKDKKS